MKIIDIPDKSQADPYVIQSGGRYYMYCTGEDGVECYVADNPLRSWKYVGYVLTVEGQKEFWAPAVIEDEGTYYMYYSSMPKTSVDVHEQRIKVAVADSPEGKFTYVKDMLEPFSIDAHVVRNESGMYMFYSVNKYEGERVGTYIVCDAMTDFFTMAKEPSVVVEPTCDEEIFQKDRFIKGQHWHTIEGAFYFKRGDYHYCMYSGNCYEKPEYHIGYAYCRSNESRLNKLRFVKSADGAFDPLISTDETETSTGHNSLMESDGQLYVVYHGRNVSSDMAAERRTARICRLFAEDGRLRVER